MTIKQSNVTLITITEANMPTCSPDSYCAICADEGLPGQVLEILPDDMVLLAMENGEQEVAIELIDNVKIGDILLVHLGFAIARIEDEA